MLHPRGPAVALGHRDSLLHSVYTDKAPPAAPPRQHPPPQQPQQQPQKQQRRDGQGEPPPPPPVAVLLESQSPELVQVSTSFCECVWPHLEQPGSGPAQELAWPPAVTWEVQLQQVADDSTQVPREPKDSDWRTVCKGEARRCKVDGLRPGRSYAARVVPHIQQSVHQLEGVQLQLECSAAKPIVFSTPATAPSAPAPPGLMSRERKQLKLKWANPDETGGAGPLRFVLFMSPAPAESTAVADVEGFVEVYRGEDKNFRVQRLQPGTRYSFRLQAMNTVGDSPVGLCSAFTTQATVPAVPEPPVPVASTSGTITLRWAAPYDNGSPVGLYQLEVDNGAGGTEFTMVYSGPNTSATATGLRSGLRYRFRLRANNDEGWSVWSNYALGTTAAVPPSSPGVVTVVTATRGNAMVSWGAPADDGGTAVTTYEVQLQAKSKAAQEQMGNDWLTIFGGHALACSINSLRAGCTYRARVRAANASGWGQFCLPSDVATLPDVPDIMDVPSVASCTSASMVVMWQPPLHDGGSKITSFRLELMPAVSTDTDAGVRTFPIRDPSACNVEVAGLYPGSVYRCRVQANNQQGPGPWSEWADLCTAPAEPLAPALPAVTASTSTSVSLLWQPPHGQGAHVSSYVVEVAMLGPAAEEARRQQQLAAWQQHRMLLDQQAASGGPGTSDQGLPPPPPEPAPLQWLEVFQGVHSACEVRGLDPATSLLIRVAAINLVGRGPWSPVLAFATPPAPPAMPEDLEMQPLSSSSLAVMWRPPVTDNGAQVSAYTVECRNGTPDAQASSKSGGSWQQVYAGPELRCMVERLQPGRLYALRVRAANPMGPGPWSSIGQCMTLPAAPGPITGRPVFSQRTATGVRVRWEPPSEDNGAPVLHYTVELARVQPTTGTLHPSVSHNGSAPGSGITATGAASSSMGAPVHAPTSSLSACSVGPGSTTPSTSPGSDDGQDGPLSFVVAYQGRDASCKLTDLQPGTKYVVRVAAANAAGQGPFGTPESFSTSLAAPSPPDMVELAESGVSADAGAWVVVRWQPPVPAAAAAPPVSYEVAAAPIAPLPGAEGTAPWTAAAERERERAWEKAATSSTAVKVTVSARSQLECRMERLQPQTFYSVRLRSVGAEGAGHSAWSTELPLLTSSMQRPVADCDASSDLPSAAGPLTTERVAQAAAPGAKKRSKAAAKAAQRTSSSSAAAPEADAAPAPAPAPVVHKAKVAKVAKVAPAKAKGPPVKKSALVQMWQQVLWPKLKWVLAIMLVVLGLMFCINGL